MIQTGKSRQIPIILVKESFWRGLLEWFRGTLVKEGSISKDDLALIQVVEEPQQVVEAIFGYYKGRNIEMTAEERHRQLEL